MMYCKCDGCGKELPAAHNGHYWSKPVQWFERLPEKETTPIHACSRECIERVEAIRRNQGKQSSSVILPI